MRGGEARFKKNVADWRKRAVSRLPGKTAHAPRNAPPWNRSGAAGPTIMRMHWRTWVICGAGLGLLNLLNGCKDEPEEEPEEQPELAQGEACDPTVERVDPEQTDGGTTGGDEELQPVCAPGLACEPTTTADGDYVCGTAVEIRGRVADSATGDGIEGALVAALNENGEPVTDVVATDSCGDYVLPVSIRRNADGSFAETPKWTLNVSAQDYLPFPAGLRPALPVDIADAMPDPDPPPPDDTDGADENSDEPTYVTDVIDNGATNVALIALPADEQGGGQISGTVGGDGAAGTLVVAEGSATRTPYAIADASGAYTIFNVPDGSLTVRGYRYGLEVETATVSTTGDHIEAVDLAVITEDPAAMASVDGSLNIVNAPGGSMTSVVLVPSSVYNDALERGPVPIGLRVPDPPMTPNVTSAFRFDGVPAGTYKVLVAFENDQLVRDPDEGIAGTAILELTLTQGQGMSLSDSFKVTEALALVGPGVDAPEAVDAMPTFEFADDSSEDGYEIDVFNALGDLVWETEIEGVSGQDTVQVPYGGPALQPGMYYQFRATSFRDPPNGDRTYISRTEDLRGVFVTGEAEPLAECTVEEEGGTGDSGGEAATGG